jgi:hypothetical protein
MLWRASQAILLEPRGGRVAEPAGVGTWDTYRFCPLERSDHSEEKSQRYGVPRKRAAGTNEGETECREVEAEGTPLTRAKMGEQRTGSF